MIKKILIFGCSFTQGSYTINNDNVIPDKIKNYHGWWYFVDYFKDKDVTVIACPGQGYWAYYQILSYLNEENKLNYDEIWIQETREPRATINDYQQISQLLKGNSSYFNILPLSNNDIFVNNHSSIHIIDNFKLIDILHRSALSLQPVRAKDENKKYTLWKSFYNDMVKSCAYNIDKLCNVRNIKGIVWSMAIPIMLCNHFTRLPLTYIKNELKNNNLLVPGNQPGLHQTEEGNKYIAKLIDEACIDMKI